MCGLFVPYCPGFAFATHHCRGVGPPARCCACTVTMPAPRQAATLSALSKRFMAAPVRKPRFGCTAYLAAAGELQMTINSVCWTRTSCRALFALRPFVIALGYELANDGI